MCACVYHCAQLLHTTQPSTVLIIFPLILQTIIIAQMLSAGGAARIWLVSKAPPTLTVCVSIGYCDIKSNKLHHEKCILIGCFQKLLLMKAELW